MHEKIAVIGLGYVGLPVAVSLAKKFDGVVGFDTSTKRVESLQSGHDWTGEISDTDLVESSLTVSDNAGSLADATFLLVTVPTPIDDEKRPDLGPIASSCRLIGPQLKKGAVIVFESTVYPGVTDDFCGPLLEKESGLVRGKDFFLAYSPERINPGDKVHRLETITKIVSAEDDATLERVKAVYGAIIEAGLHVAPSIKVAEAAKVIENTQRDLNIALMNEIALIFDLMGIRTKDVLAAAGTKWNFLPFSPGLVGGHCIGVDPYYLTSAAEKLGYRPEVILAGRRINDEMGAFVARKTVKLLVQSGVNIKDARVGVLGLTFKENVPDLRNSKVPDIIAELAEYGIDPIIHDPYANSEEAMREYGLQLSSMEKMHDLDAVILTVNHDSYLEDISKIVSKCKRESVFLDVKSAVDPASLPPSFKYWCL
ncbi:MAG: nucleotide sugar dehydrogenase [Parasphingorhabdus sp.]|uniref:nucleotide sugar dehydrogenase n=1 Tax=Parasphingorhabdus sp. TaxID=2709688 RepID=UPI0032989A95